MEKYLAHKIAMDKTNEAILEATNKKIGAPIINMLSNSDRILSQRHMPEFIRSEMEQKFNANLNNVNLYEGSLVEQTGAKAYASGSSIAFAPGKLDFSSLEGKKLLGHELSHIIYKTNEEGANTAEEKIAKGENAFSHSSASTDKRITPMTPSHGLSDFSGAVSAKKGGNKKILDSYEQSHGDYFSAIKSNFIDGRDKSAYETPTQRTYDYRTATSFLRSESKSLRPKTLKANKAWNKNYEAAYTGKDSEARFKMLDSIIEERYLSKSLTPEMTTEKYYIDHHREMSKFILDSVGIENLMNDNKDYFAARPEIAAQLTDLTNRTLGFSSIAANYDINNWVDGGMANLPYSSRNDMKASKTKHDFYLEQMYSPEQMAPILANQITDINEYNKKYGKKK